jgi:hypothetical protein
MAVRDMHFDFNFDTPTPHIAPMPPMAPMAIETHIAPMVMGIGRDFTDRMPPAPWAQGDPADSVYRIARDALGRGDYGRAARLFAEIPQKYQNSAYKNDATYYRSAGALQSWHDRRAEAGGQGAPAAREARCGFLRHIGERAGAAGLQVRESGPSDSEVTALYVRINGALAQRGDKDAVKAN